jgi:hypothetical protein
MTQEIVLNLPLPPSLNGAYSTVGRRRVKSKKYRDWLNAADGYLLTQQGWRKPIIGPYTLHISIPQSMRGDATNRVKLCEDYLVSRFITSDDRFCQSATVERDATISKNMCKVMVRGI